MSELEKVARELEAKVNEQRERIAKLEEALRDSSYALEQSVKYVQGAYECAFSDSQENNWVHETVNNAIEKNKSLLS